MNTNQIQRFATSARNILIQGVNAKLNLLGFDADGYANPDDYPRRYSDSTVFQGRVIPGTRFYDQWNELQQRIVLIGRDDVCEEAAYTWFNRLVALRILQKNGIIQPVIDYDNPAVKVPRIVTDARRGRAEYLQPSDRQQLSEILSDDAQVFEQFQILITAFCHNHPILKACFGGITGYTELLLPNNILVEGNFIDLINNTDYLTDDDYRQSELIGWLYQFYISEKKNEVFASFKEGKKAEADQIPAATQIFTPNWIVKYMVQNTVGRIYLDNHPSSPLKDQWKYLADSPSEREQGGVLKLQNLESLTCADLSCGSGHILGEFFEMLYQMYDEELYEPRQAVESILQNNILGIDLDTRAKQLSMFALLLKACQKDISFADAHCLPRVLDMPEPLLSRCKNVPIGAEASMHTFQFYPNAWANLDLFFSQTAPDETIKQILQAFSIMADAYNLGSIMRFDITPVVRYAITEALAYWNNKDEIPDKVQEVIPSIQLLLALTDKYDAVVMNPPYMGSGNMNGDLSQYVKDNYEKGKADLCTAFMLMQAERTAEGGYYANIVPPSWLFISSFEALRLEIIDNQSIQSMLHLSRGVFGADFGSVCSVIQNHTNKEAKGTYFRLIERTFQEFEQQHLKLLFEQTLANHDFRYEFSKYDKNTAVLQHSINGNRIYYPNIPQKNFKDIPGNPIGYWLSKRAFEIIKSTSISDYFNPATGLQTGDNKRFIRSWYEVSKKDLNCNWLPLVNGGEFRKWYGNLQELIWWRNNGEDIRNCRSSVLRNQQYYLKPGVSWSRIASKGIALRAFPSNCLFDQAGDSMFADNLDDLFCCMAYLNSKVAKLFFDILAPTLNLTAGMIGKLPYVHPIDKDIILDITSQNYTISKQDWDAHETSWDFNENELVRIYKEGRTSNIETTVNAYRNEWDENFRLLHDNEEELNRQFIEIYGLQDELSPDVPYDEVTILQDEFMFVPSPGSDGFMTPIWCEDKIIQQFISYAIGCLMGRYRLDRPGLHIAHPNPSDEELASYFVDGASDVFHIDNDAIIPILPIDAPFPDNAANRITDFVKFVFGTDNINENMNYIQDALGMSVADYMTKNCYTDHKKRYQNRPIYWLFSSKKGAF